jgi:hypothetical protein
MENNPTPPALRTYAVYADRRVFQHVDAAGPAEAVRTAREHPWEFEPCSHGIENFELSPFVTDVDAGEDVRVGSPATHCRTCGSEVVETVNESHFREGECGPCEYRRYRSAGALAAAAAGPGRDACQKAGRALDAGTGRGQPAGPMPYPPTPSPDGATA